MKEKISFKTPAPCVSRHKSICNTKQRDIKGTINPFPSLSWDTLNGIMSKCHVETAPIDEIDPCPADSYS